MSVIFSFVQRKILRFLCVAALGLVLFDAVADSSACKDSAASTASVCHVCSCGPHLGSQESPKISANLNPSAFVPHEASVYAFLLPQFIFHPPRLLA